MDCGLFRFWGNADRPRDAAGPNQTKQNCGACWNQHGQCKTLHIDTPQGADDTCLTLRGTTMLRDNVVLLEPKYQKEPSP